MTKRVFTVHIGLTRFEVVERSYTLISEGQLNSAEKIVSSFDDVNKALSDMHEKNEKLPDTEYLYADERRRAKGAYYAN